MPNELSAERKNIKDLFNMRGNKFIIPEYQRPYRWEQEQCDVLWNDIVDFNEAERDEDTKSLGKEYFLGTIVICDSETSENREDKDVIDGQQRLTSLLLLLKAFHYKLKNMQQDDDVRGLITQIEPCIYNTDELSGKADLEKIRIEPKIIATNSDNKEFVSIMKGKAEESFTSLYYKNYKYFLDKCDEYARDNPLMWKYLLSCILSKCILLPITCENTDTALTIFSTLNNRGMPLSDADIFKSKIYSAQGDDQEKTKFTSAWQELVEKAEDAKLSMDDLFRYYSHIIRAKKNDTNKEMGLRKFYTQDRDDKLRENGLVFNLDSLAEFWFNVNNGTDCDYLSEESRKYIHCLNLYSNEFWKYLVSVFWYKKYKEEKEENFTENFAIFLKKLTAFLYARFLEKPTITAVKDKIYKACALIYNNTNKKDDPLRCEMNTGDDNFRNILRNSYNWRISKGLLLVHAYQEENQKLIKSFEVEHIFPKKWQDTNYNGWKIENASEYLERFGNKVVIEKKINI